MKPDPSFLGPWFKVKVLTLGLDFVLAPSPCSFKSTIIDRSYEIISYDSYDAYCCCFKKELKNSLQFDVHQYLHLLHQMVMLLPAMRSALGQVGGFDSLMYSW